MGNVGSSKEKRIWATREKKIKARRNSKKRHSLVRRRNEKRKKTKRTSRCPVLSGEAFSGVDPETSRAMPEYYDSASTAQEVPKKADVARPGRTAKG